MKSLAMVYVGCSAVGKSSITQSLLFLYHIYVDRCLRQIFTFENADLWGFFARRMQLKKVGTLLEIV